MFLQDYAIDNDITYDEYISATKSGHHNPEARVQIYIENSSRGKDISFYNEKEQEILYNRNSTFKVNKIKVNGDIVYILMEEKDGKQK